MTTYNNNHFKFHKEKEMKWQFRMTELCTPDMRLTIVSFLGLPKKSCSWRIFNDIAT